MRNGKWGGVGLVEVNSYTVYSEDSPLSPPSLHTLRAAYFPAAQRATPHMEFCYFFALSYRVETVTV